MAIDLNTRLYVDNGKALADNGLSVHLSELEGLVGNNLKIDSGNQPSAFYCPNFITLKQVHKLLNSISVPGFDLSTRVVIDNSKQDLDAGGAVGIADVLTVVNA